MEQTECSETSALKIQTPGNNPKESIQNSFVVRPVTTGRVLAASSWGWGRWKCRGAGRFWEESGG